MIGPPLLDPDVGVIVRGQVPAPLKDFRLAVDALSRYAGVESAFMLKAKRVRPAVPGWRVTCGGTKHGRAATCQC
jgi:hypothetical protein